MSGETILVFGTPKTLEANGASIANNAIGQADDASYDVVADGANYPDAKFVFTGAFGTGPTENTTLAVYARPLDIAGTADGEVPETTRPTIPVCVMVVNNVTSTQNIEAVVERVPWKADYYIHNNGTGQTLSAGWTLTVTPCTLAPAP